MRMEEQTMRDNMTELTKPIVKKWYYSAEYLIPLGAMVLLGIVVLVVWTIFYFTISK